ncbi:hypothetical protein QR305_00063 [Bacteroides finegoldii]|uniref:Uncharacterized protein n=1 Tax=Bacteroides finegoldii CL09T03C10 TaxID=997888 RepID=K5CP03_9BACE|nr:hypothetical protein HMPREF1057_01857 [Bacteroides finegoldii CL09T03C10]
MLLLATNLAAYKIMRVSTNYLFIFIFSLFEQKSTQNRTIPDILHRKTNDSLPSEESRSYQIQLL